MPFKIPRLQFNNSLTEQVNHSHNNARSRCQTAFHEILCSIKILTYAKYFVLDQKLLSGLTNSIDFNDLSQ